MIGSLAPTLAACMHARLISSLVQHRACMHACMILLCRHDFFPSPELMALFSFKKNYNFFLIFWSNRILCYIYEALNIDKK